MIRYAKLDNKLGIQDKQKHFLYFNALVTFYFPGLGINKDTGYSKRQMMTPTFSPDAFLGTENRDWRDALTHDWRT